MPKDEEHTNNIKQFDVRDREEKFSQNYTKLKVSQPVSQSDRQTQTGRQVFSQHTKKTERKREASVFTALLQKKQWGCWIRDCVKQNTTQYIVPCRMPHAP